MFGIKSTERIKNIHQKADRAERGVLWASVIAFVIATFFAVFNKSSAWSVNIIPTVMSTLSTLVFSWLITKNTTAQQKDAELKQIAGRAYRRNRSLVMKLDYVIGVIEDLYSFNNCNSAEVCQHRRELLRIRDSVVLLGSDATENMGDWQAFFAEEMGSINKLLDLNEKIKQESGIFQDEENRDNERNRLKELQKEYDKLKETLPPDFKVILDSEITQKNVLDNRREQQKRMHRDRNSASPLIISGVEEWINTTNIDNKIEGDATEEIML